MFAGLRRLHVLCGIAAALSAGIPSVHAQESSAQSRRTFQFNIQAKPLLAALVDFTDVTGVQLVYPSRDELKVTSHAVSGAYSAQDALRQMLQGTGIAFRYTNQNTVTLLKESEKGARTLGPVRVEGSASVPPSAKIGEGVATLGGVRGHQEDETLGYRPLVTTVGAGRPIPIEDNARAVSVLTRDQMEDQNVNDLGEALGRLPGVTITDEIYSRGQTIDRFQVDGGPAQDLSNFIGSMGPERGGAFNLAAYERVELLRGANAAFVGTGSLGGTLNLIRKRPGSVPSETLTLTAGSWNRWEGLYDVTVPNIADSNIAFRGVVNLQSTEAFYDKFQRDNNLLYGIFDLPLSQTSRGELGVRYTNSETESPYQSVLRYADGPLFDVPRSTNFGPNWGFDDMEETEVFTRIKTDFSEDWSVDIGLSWLSQSSAEAYAGQEGNFTVLSNGGNTSYVTEIEDFQMSRNRVTTLTGDVRLTGKFETWGIVHNLFARAAYFDIDNSLHGGDWKIGYTRSVDSLDDFFLDDLSEESAWGYRNTRSDRRVQTSIEDLMTWHDKVDLRLALSGYTSNSFEFTPAYVWHHYFADGRDLIYPTTTSNRRFKPDWTPSYAVVFKPWRGWSIAPSYSEGTTDQSSYYSPNGERLSPATYQGKEVMIRHATGQWVASVSYYTADNTNVAEPVPGLLSCAPTGVTQCYFPGGGNVKARGYDLEVAGTFFNQLEVSASYNFNETQVASRNAPLNSQSPTRIAKLFVNWTPTFLPRLSLNAGYSHRSDIHSTGEHNIFDDQGEWIGSLPFKFMSKGYHVFDLGARYVLSPTLELAVLAENLTDETYLSSTSQYNGYYARPRNVTISVKWLDASIKRWGGAASVQDYYPLGDPSRWYTALDIGRHAPATLNASSRAQNGSSTNWEWTLGSNSLTFWRLGRHLDPRWRVELEAGFRPTDIDSTYISVTSSAGICSTVEGAPAHPDCRPETGKFDTFTTMVNGLYSLRNEQARVSAFVGLGLGVAISQVEIGGRLSSLSPIGTKVTLGADDTIVKPAAQAIAGLTVKLLPRLNADLTYRYFYAPGIDWQSKADYYDYETGYYAGSAGHDAFEADLEDQSVTLALRWNFDLGG